jgi:hypothetical protein
MPPKGKTKGRPTLLKPKVCSSAVAHTNFHLQNLASSEMRLAPWDRNSCFIDCVAEFIQRAVLPMVSCGPDNENDMTTLLKEWKRHIKFDGYVKGTEFVRDFFWANGFEKGALGDCQLIYHKLTDDGPINTLMSYCYDDGYTKKAFEIIRSIDDPPLFSIFSQQNYQHPALVTPPKFITINDIINSPYNQNQYDYPDTFTVKSSLIGYRFQICGRIMAQTTTGGHFFTIMQIGNKKYQVDNMKNKMVEFAGNQSGKMVNTLYVFYKQIDFLQELPSLSSPSPSSPVLSRLPPLSPSSPVPSFSSPPLSPIVSSPLPSFSSPVPSFSSPLGFAIGPFGSVLLGTETEPKNWEPKPNRTE